MEISISFINITIQTIYIHLKKFNTIAEAYINSIITDIYYITFIPIVPFLIGKVIQVALFVRRFYNKTSFDSNVRNIMAKQFNIIAGRSVSVIRKHYLK